MYTCMLMKWNIDPESMCDYRCICIYMYDMSIYMILVYIYDDDGGGEGDWRVRGVSIILYKMYYNMYIYAILCYAIC